MYIVIKRLIDFHVSIVLLAILSPLLILLVLIVRIRIGSPVLFQQKRPGKSGEIFTFYKFRTMSTIRDLDGRLLEDKDRMTAFGSFLRATSLDELPSLFNVLKGDMSLVGPRPLLIEYLPLYSDVQGRRHEVKPGITGWAQINGRNAISWEEKFKYDVWYVDNCSIFLDIKIIFLTIGKVIMRKGISSDTSATMEKFEGSKRK
jgi:sugar transferase EpsL